MSSLTRRGILGTQYELSEADRQLFEQAVEQFAQRGGRAQVAAKEGPLNESDTRRSRRTAKRAALPNGRLDLHGRRADEAIDLVDQFLAQASSGQRLLIVHGRGTGKLSQVVRSALLRDDRVCSWEVATPKLGGEGAVLVRRR